MADLTCGEYYIGNYGRNPEWNTYGDFRWKLTLEMLPELLENISSHPESLDSMAKSSFIFRFLMENEAKLHGMVYIGGGLLKFDAYSDIVNQLRHDGPFDHGSDWNGKWLYTKSLDLVSQTEITKWDLNPQLYSDVVADSKLYEILGFKKSA